LIARHVNHQNVQHQEEDWQKYRKIVNRTTLKLTGSLKSTILDQCRQQALSHPLGARRVGLHLLQVTTMTLPLEALLADHLLLANLLSRLLGYPLNLQVQDSRPYHQNPRRDHDRQAPLFLRLRPPNQRSLLPN